MLKKMGDDGTPTIAHNGESQGVSSSPHTFLHQGDSSHSFVEYLGLDDPSNTTSNRSFTVDALAVDVDAKDCSRIVKTLSRYLPLPPTLQHLKRVKKSTTNVVKDSEAKSPSQKRIRTEPEPEPKRPPSQQRLQILLGLSPLSTLLESFEVVDDSEGGKLLLSPADQLLALITNEKSSLSSSTSGTTSLSESGLLQNIIVPNHPPNSQEEAKLANQLWPTHFFPLKTLEYQEQKRSLSLQEFEIMVNNVEELSTQNNEAFVFDPSSNRVLSKSGNEERLQNAATLETSSICQRNPLATPILLAIQGISRLERQGNSDHYLCSGFHLYCNYEPCVFESMALVHSRFGRVIWASLTPDPPGSVLRQGISIHSIHCLPGTNHHFRAFEYRPTALRDHSTQPLP